MQNKVFNSLAIAALLMSLTGCATTGLFKFGHNDFPTAGPNNPVTEIMGVWQPGVGIGVDNKACRGFTGQVVFFSQRGDTPVQVNGDVKIIVYDDQGTAEEQVKPIGEHEFAPRAWNALLSKGPLGATYQIFVPYTRPGHHAAKCALRIRFTPRDGARTAVYSEMVNIVLEGKKKSSTTDNPGVGSPDGGNYDDSPTADAASRKPPHVRGLADAIPLTGELQASQTRRKPAAELTDDEKARIIREARARLKAETNGKVELVSHEESDPDAVPAKTRPGIERPRKPTRNKVGRSSRDDFDVLDAVDSDELASLRVGRRGAFHRHDFDDDDEAPPEATTLSPSRSTKPMSRANEEGEAIEEPANRRRHLLEDE